MFLKTPAILKAILATILYAAISISAQEPSFRALHVGDPAPELKVTWIKGEPITGFDPEKTYVVEFWATWCGPCKAAMPHLSELAKKYHGEVEFIGVNILEEGFTDHPYDKCLPMVKAFVSEMGEKMSYRVAVESNSLYMTTYWFNASGQRGIPAAFIVKNGNIIWIGGPGDIEKILMEMSSGIFDMQFPAKRVDDALNDDAQNSPGLRAYLELIYVTSGAISENKFEFAINILNENKNKFSGDFQTGIKAQKLRALIHVDTGRFLELAGELQKESPGFGRLIANSILSVKEGGLSENFYNYAIRCLLASSKKGTSNHTSQAAIFNSIGICHFRAGHRAKAIKTQMKVVKLAEAELASGKFRDVSKSVIDGYKATLEAYRK